MKNRVKELREAKHLTQTGLALKVGSTQQTISKIEREIGVPKLDLALIMADFFNVTLEYLFCLSDKKHKLEHQIKIDKTIEEFYDFFVDYQDLNSENKVTLNLIMLRLLEVEITIGTNRNKKRKCNIRKTNFLISGANICKRNCHVK